MYFDDCFTMSCHLSHEVSDTQVTDPSKLYRHAQSKNLFLHQYDDVIVHKQPHHQLNGSNNFTQLAHDFCLIGEIISCNSHHRVCLKTSAAFWCSTKKSEAACNLYLCNNYMSCRSKFNGEKSLILAEQRGQHWNEDFYHT